MLFTLFAISGSGTTLVVVDLGLLDATADEGDGTLEQALGVVCCVVIFLGPLSILLFNGCFSDSWCFSKGLKLVKSEKGKFFSWPSISFLAFSDI